MLRLAAWRVCEAGIVPNMLIHDGILIEARSKEEIAHTIEIMRAAGRDVCNGLEVGDAGMQRRYRARIDAVFLVLARCYAGVKSLNFNTPFVRIYVLRHAAFSTSAGATSRSAFKIVFHICLATGRLSR